MTHNDVVTALAELVRPLTFTDASGKTAQFKDVYLNCRPRDFVRPSALSQFVGAEFKPFTGVSDLCAARYAVTVFVDVDERYQTHFLTLNAATEAVAGLFLGRYITVGERCPHVTGVALDPQYDYAAVTVTLEYEVEAVTPEESPILEHYDLVVT